MMSLRISNHDLCKVLWENTSAAKSKDDKLNLLLEKMKKTNTFDKNQIRIIRRELSRRFLSYYNQKWNEKRVSRKKDKFEKIHSQWLESEFTVEFDAPALDDNQDLEQDNNGEVQHPDERGRDDDNDNFELVEEM